MKKPYSAGAVFTCLFALCTITTNAALLPLESRLGGLAYYDPNLNITWAANANINSNDAWYNQVTWAAGLVIGGVSGWRLPSADVNGDDTVVDCSGGGVSGCADNEMGFLYWEEGIIAAAPGPFSHVQSSFYWSGTEYAPDTGGAWLFGFGGEDMDGVQLAEAKPFLLYAWAVRTGDVPVPPAVWLFCSGLLYLVGMARRKKVT